MSISLKMTRSVLNLFKSFLPKEIKPQTIRAIMGTFSYGKWIMGKKITVEEWPQSGNLCPVEIMQTKQPHYTILYLHGGGYFFGEPSFYRLLIKRLLKKLPARVYFPEYRLAPEHPFPAAFDDGLAWYRYLIQNKDEDSPLIVMGDSAGGGLSVAVLQAARDANLPMPDAMVLFSPWMDLTGESLSMCECQKTDVMFCHEWFSLATQWYADGQDLHQPAISPLFGEMKGLPSSLIFASSDEMLRDDSTTTVEKMKAAKVPIQFISRAKMPHIWPVLAHLPEAKKAINQVVDFIKSECQKLAKAA